MKMIILIVLMISGAFGTGGTTLDSRYGGGETELVQPIVPVNHSFEAAVLAFDDKAAAGETEELTKHSAVPAHEFTLESVGGITLYDTRDTVTSKLGEPEAIERDELWPGLEVYRYRDLHVAFYEEQLQYVDVPLAEELLIDGVSVPMTEEAFRDRLGEPDFMADDGVVFQRGEAVLKLFIDYEANKPLYVSYYHIATV